eukprot:1160005-Pelagomonas_calceolata.AAC.7
MWCSYPHRLQQYWHLQRQPRLALSYPPPWRTVPRCPTASKTHACCTAACALMHALCTAACALAHWQGSGLYCSTHEDACCHTGVMQGERKASSQNNLLLATQVSYRRPPAPGRRHVQLCPPPPCSAAQRAVLQESLPLID